MAAIEKSGPGQPKHIRGALVEKRGDSWRVRIRIRGVPHKSETFSTDKAAWEWADRQVRNADQIRATGVTAVELGDTVADLITRYVAEFEAKKRWGRTKSADLARLQKDLGGESLRSLTTATITNHFRKRADEGAGPVTVSSQIGYLATVFKTGRSLWHLNVP